ncbi:nucleotidyltransferase family protein [Polaribacter sp.]|uniref:nucleotidyltransferase family protein n=1 Tax=Polaribacter sp. TaxID=1920175 RepID=UPI0025CCC46F|nr:nucleotidyltransferase family protein [Polaribacter sp.]
MNYKESLYFVAKCLTISFEEKNKDEIELILKATNVDWDRVVKVSTSHYVFPALYCNFKRADFLKYLPADLVDYMKYITNLNRDRNNQIIGQAKKLNNLLLDNGVKPIFLKGTGNLLEGLYEDIGERMVGDIDFLFSEENFFKTINILKNDGYAIQENQSGFLPGFRHYPKLVKYNNISSVEIHKEVTIEKFRDEFNCKMISENVQQIDSFSVLSFENQLLLSIISSQINDYGFELKTFSLRNAYDVFLMSKKVDTKKVVSNFTKLKIPLNCFIANCNLVFGDLESLGYFKTKESENYLKAFNNSLNKKESNLKINFKLFKINLIRRLGIVCKSIFNSEIRKWLLNTIIRKISN